MKRFDSATPFLVALLAGAPCSVRAAVISWMNNFGGNANVASNWTPSQLPGPADTMVFGTIGVSTIGVSWVAGSPALVDTMRLTGSTNLQLTLASPLSVAHCVVQSDAAVSGTLTVQGGTLTAGTMDIGTVVTTGPTGTLNVSGGTARVVVDGAMNIGAANNGFANVQLGGRITANGPVRVTQDEASILTVTGTDNAGLLRSTFETTGLGDTLTIGAVVSGTLNVQQGGLVSVADDIVVSCTTTGLSSATVGGALNGFSSTMTTASDLFIGNNAGQAGAGRGRLVITSQGIVQVAGDTIVGDPDGGSGTLTVQGGKLTTHNLQFTPSFSTLTFSSGEIELTGGQLFSNSPLHATSILATLSGSGTIDAPISQVWNILPSGAGFTVKRSFQSGASQVIAGSRMTFANGSTYAGATNLNCEVLSLPGSTIAPFANLFMGNSLSTNGVAIGGLLYVGLRGIDLLDLDGPVVTGTVDIGGGELFAGASLTFAGAESSLTGFGSVFAPVTMQGNISPGVATGDITGSLQVDNLFMTPSANIDMDIEGPGVGQFDTIQVIDDFSPGGATLNVTLRNGYVPSVNDVFRIITAGANSQSLIGAVNAPGFHIEEFPGGVDIVYDGALCDSIDFNNDGLFPDSADIDDYLSVFSGGACSNGPSCHDIDFNNDGLFPDSLDIDSFLSVFSGGACL